MTRIGPDRVGYAAAHHPQRHRGCQPQETYLAAAPLGQLGVVYLHVAEADWDDAPLMAESFKQAATPSQHLIYAGKCDGERAAPPSRQAGPT